MKELNRFRQFLNENTIPGTSIVQAFEEYIKDLEAMANDAGWNVQELPMWDDAVASVRDEFEASNVANTSFDTNGAYDMVRYFVDTINTINTDEKALGDADLDVEHIYKDLIK